MLAKHLIDTPYGDVICNYLVREFPRAVRPNQKELLEILTDILVGTKDLRYGPTPPPEHLVVIRKVIRESIERDEPIPVLIPWGGVKGNMSSSLDVAELSAMRQILKVSEEIERLFSPGISAVVRVEDLGAKWLFRDQLGLSPVIDDYSTSLEKLVRLIDEKRTISTVKEGLLMNEKEYFILSEKLSLLIEAYITRTDAYPESIGKGDAFEELKKLGWNGIIPIEQREFYRSRYRALYPMAAEEDHTQRLADYFAGAKARKDLHGTGIKGEHVQITFMQPIPGAPANMFNNALYYRTTSASESRSHIPAWRAKGFLKIGRDNSVMTKVTNYHDRETLDSLTEAEVLIGDEGMNVKVRTDYVVAA